MNRRLFFQHCTFASAFPWLLLNACRPRLTDRVDNPSNAIFPLSEMSIGTMQAEMAKGNYSSRGLVELYLERIRQIDSGGMALHAVIEINPDVLVIADACDQQRKAGQIKSPLHGIPFLIKDNIDTADKMMTTAGSLAMSGNYARHDAVIVRQLRAAGAVILGKTNLSEWANFRSTRSSSGWSSRGGQTRNPYSLDRNPCGSSSGSAVAVAANLCSFAIGTETNGSISCPSSVNGIVGLKPTVGIISRSGIIPISKTQDTAGPMTRTVRDAAIVLGLINGHDPNDETTLPRPASLPEDYTVFLNAEALSGKRIGVERSFLNVHESVDALLRHALDEMKRKGATIVEVDFKARLKEIGDNEYKVLQFEFKDGLNRYLQGADAPLKSLAEVIAYNRQHADKVMPWFQQEILEASESRGDLRTDEYQIALQKVVNISRAAIDTVMSEHDLHAICGPATGAAWCTDVVNGDSFSGYGMGSGAAMAGYPSITVPLGDVHGLPVGLLFTATAYAEPELLAIAYAYEQATRFRASPGFRERLL